MQNHRLSQVQNRCVFISCVVPIYNEESNILPFFGELCEKLASLTHHYEIIAINDGSRDGSQEKLLQAHQQFGIKILEFSRNFGKEMAITAGLEHTRGDVVIILDGDFQHPFATFDAFLAEWAVGYDMVYGIRTNRQHETVVKRLFAQTFYKIMSSISHASIPANAGDFRLLDRKVVDALNQTPERARFMKGLYSWVGYKSIGIAFEVQQRTRGKSTWRFTNLLDLAITGIVSFSDIPLRAWGILGFGISAVAFLSILYIIGNTLMKGSDVPGYATLLVAITFFGGIQLLSVGILGEYIARIFNEVKRRPAYLLNTKIGFEEE